MLLLLFQEKQTRMLASIAQLEIPQQLAFVFSKLDGKKTTVSRITTSPAWLLVYATGFRHNKKIEYECHIYSESRIINP